MTIRRSQAYNNIDTICDEWEGGVLVTALARKHHCDARIIKTIIVAKVGEAEYRRTNRARTGAGAAKRRKTPQYPEWLKGNQT